MNKVELIELLIDVAFYLSVSGIVLLFLNDSGMLDYFIEEFKHWKKTRNYNAWQREATADLKVRKIKLNDNIKALEEQRDDFEKMARAREVGEEKDIYQAFVLNGLANRLEDAAITATKFEDKYTQVQERIIRGFVW